MEPTNKSPAFLMDHIIEGFMEALRPMIDAQVTKDPSSGNLQRLYFQGMAVMKLLDEKLSAMYPDDYLQMQQAISAALREKVVDAIIMSQMDDDGQKH